MNKISFDFDGTLDRLQVQEYAKELVQNDEVEVYVCTYRFRENASSPNQNDDLYQICDDLGISRDRIIFTHGQPKSLYLDNSFIWHLDDDWEVLYDLRSHSKIMGVSCFRNSAWRNKCNRLLRQK